MSGKHEVQTRGIVLSRFSSGEGSVRAIIFTEALGLVSTLAKSAREERSKLRPHLTVGTYGHFGFVRGAQVWRLVGATETRNTYFALSGRPKAQYASARFLSLLRTLIQGEERDEELFAHAWNFMCALESVPDELLVHVERFATLAVLASLGYVSKDAVPGAPDFDYTPSAIEALVPLEKQIATAIQNGFSASGLI